MKAQHFAGPFCCMILAAQIAVGQTSQSSGDAALLPDTLRLHQLQMIGTHNSYHIQPAAGIAQLIGLAGGSILQGLQYSHRPIPEQLQELKIRQLELDLFADPDGGLFSNPLGRQLSRMAGGNPGPDPNHGGVLDRPGIKVLHAPGFDYLTTVADFRTALEQVERWSEANPKHLPVMILLELKETVPNPTGVQLVKWTAERFRELEAEIRSVIPAESVIRPSSLRKPGDSSIGDAVRKRGWPTIGSIRGRLFFCLDNEGIWVQRYLEAVNEASDPLLFVSVGPDHPRAAWMKRNDPIGQQREIRQLVQTGFLVRTRADADTRDARANQTRRREHAFTSGAQYISTDFPEANAEFSGYRVRLPDGHEAIRNPLHPPLSQQ